jgi:hypothetical protein
MRAERLRDRVSWAACTCRRAMSYLALLVSMSATAVERKELTALPKASLALMISSRCLLLFFSRSAASERQSLMLRRGSCMPTWPMSVPSACSVSLSACCSFAYCTARRAISVCSRLSVSNCARRSRSAGPGPSARARSRSSPPSWSTVSTTREHALRKRCSKTLDVNQTPDDMLGAPPSFPPSRSLKRGLLSGSHFYFPERGKNTKFTFFSDKLCLGPNIICDI